MHFYLNNTYTTVLKVLSLFALGLVLISCGGGGSSGGGGVTATTLTGTAAVGVPFPGDVNVRDSLDEVRTATLDASGNYTIDVTGMTPPFIITAEPTDTSMPTQYSYASTANITVDIVNTANATPLTTLALYNANSQQDLDTLQNDWVNQFAGITQQAIDDAQAIINANFASLYTAAGLDPANFDLFMSPFNADGTGIDGVLDILDIVLDPTTNSFTVAVNDVPFMFDPDINNGGGGSNTVTFSGDGVSEIVPNPFPSNVFTPQEFTEVNLGVTILDWKFTDGTTEWDVGITEGVSVSFTRTLNDGNTQTSQGWVLSGNAGVTISADSVLFNNVTLTGSISDNPPAPTMVIINGELLKMQP